MSLWSLAAVFLVIIPPGWVRPMETVELRMPNIIPTQTDAYLCYSFTIPIDETWYITAIGPILTDPEAVHHVTVRACPEGDSENGVWNCGEAVNDKAFPTGPMCDDDKYDWTKDVREFHLPKGVAYKVGGDRDYQVLIVQVHYSDVSRFNESFRDATGAKITFTRKRTPKLAGSISFSAQGLIPAGRLVNMESQCVVHLPDDTTLRIASYLVHTHELGLVVTDYRVRDGVWTEIGQRSPQLPKEFVPTNVTLQNGDIVVLRCLMYNFRDHAVMSGLTHHDEMCITRLLFYAENGEFIPSFECDEMDPSDFATMTSR